MKKISEVLVLRKPPPFKIFREFKGGAFLSGGGFLNTHMTQKIFAPSARLSINQWFYTVLVYLSLAVPETENLCTFDPFSSVFTTKTTHF